MHPTARPRQQPEGDIVFEIEETAHIAQPIERVWAFIDDETNNPLWQTTLTDVHRVTERESPHHSSIASVKAPFAREGSYTLVDDGDGTLFTIRQRDNPGGFFRIAEPVLERFARREINGNLGNPSDVLEGGLGSASPAPLEVALPS